MKIYAIATRQRECYGHSDYREELMIKQVDAYHKKGKWSPIFKDKISADKYLDQLSYKSDKQVVELELI